MKVNRKEQKGLEALQWHGNSEKDARKFVNNRLFESTLASFYYNENDNSISVYNPNGDSYKIQPNNYTMVSDKIEVYSEGIFKQQYEILEYKNKTP